MIGQQLKEHLHQLAPYRGLESPSVEQYEDIQLDAEDLRKAREDKHNRLKREKYLEEIRTIRPARTFSAEEYYTAFKQIFPIDEVHDEWYSKIVKRLCCYFANDKRFETNDLKLNRGILLFGGVGVGKTTLLQAFRLNQAFSFKIVSCREVESEFAMNGDEAIGKYSVNQPALAINSNPFGQQEIGYCFDDLGTENSVTKHFGNAKSVMADILLNRYDSGLSPRATHITTNLSEKEIETYYGTRVLDRMHENFNVIVFPSDAKSRR
jgi:DNA replication protein DnaC